VGAGYELVPKSNQSGAAEGKLGPNAVGRYLKKLILWTKFSIAIHSVRCKGTGRVPYEIFTF